MTKKSSNFTNRILQHIDTLDAKSLQHYMRRLIKDYRFLEGIFNTIREAILVIDNSLCIQFVNSAAKGMLAISPEAIGEPIAKYFKQIPWQELLRPGLNITASSRREIEITYPEHRVLSFYLMPLSESRNALKHPNDPLATLIFQDMTESVQAAEVNLETQKIKAITQLAAGVAHELGNPLNSLGIHQQLLQRALRKMPESPEQKQALESVQTSLQEIRRLDTIVKNFLSAVRPVPLNSAQLDIPRILAAAVAFMRMEIEDKGIEVDVNLPQNIPTIFGDADQLTQAFFNLIKNAIQAMTDGGKLSIFCDVDDQNVNISFCDTGKGISEEELRQLLDPFFTTKSSGTGLGLLIVDRIVRAHGGTLTISGEPAKGAVFTISLPLQFRQVRLLN